MAFCTKCGSKLNEGAAFCVTCGTPAGASAGAGTRPADVPAPPPVRNSYAPSGVTATPNLVARVTNILTKPKQEWPVIADESTQVASLYTGYIVILAAIPVVANFIKASIIGTSVFGITYRTGMTAGIIGAIVQYVLSLGGVYIAAFIIEKLAPSFQSQGTTIDALKLVAYASTASWIAGIFGILPIIGILGVLAGGIYSIYLFYLGLPVMMRTPQDKVVIYMIASAVVIFVIYLVIGFVVGAITAASYIGARSVTPF